MSVTIIQWMPDIRTIFWKTVLISTVYFIPVIRTYFPTPKGVLITGIHGITSLIYASEGATYNHQISTVHIYRVCNLIRVVSNSFNCI